MWSGDGGREKHRSQPLRRRRRRRRRCRRARRGHLQRRGGVERARARDTVAQRRERAFRPAATGCAVRPWTSGVYGIFFWSVVLEKKLNHPAKSSKSIPVSLIRCIKCTRVVITHNRIFIY